MSETFDLTQIQGNILRGYKRNHVRHLVLEIRERRAARRFLGLTVSGDGKEVPRITREAAAKWEKSKKPDLCFNVGMTFKGLLELGAPEGLPNSLPTEFVEGMPARAAKIGDVGESAPDKWLPEFRDPGRVHIIASLYADDPGHIDKAVNQIVQYGGAFAQTVALTGESLDGGKVHFGYTDNISQPRFEEVPDPERDGETEPFDPLGTILLGHPTTFEGLYWRDLKEHDLLFNGTFNAFRMMKQDVKDFEDYLGEAAGWLLEQPENQELLAPGDELHFADLLKNVYGEPRDAWSHERTESTRLNAMREIVAAQFGGRWRNGNALAQAPQLPGVPAKKPRNDFEYPRDTRCPAGSHVRRCNPRGGQIVQRVANYSRRLIRRGMVYGTPYNPGDGSNERGLIGNFIGASLGAQFEAMMCDWLNLGLHDPDITGSNDPLLGANSPETSWFDLELAGGKTLRLHGFKRFVTTRAGAYVFLPSLKAIEKISEWGD